MTDLNHLLDGAIAPFADGARYALIDYPMYHNPGDAAIWAGTRIVLERVLGRPPSHVSTLNGFDPQACRRAIGTGRVFLLGGGNFGGLYARHHQYRLRAITGLHGTPIVQLPFSVAGLDADSAAETRRVLSGHGAVTLIARDRRSQSLARDLLGVEVALAPDGAHALRLSVAPPIGAETRQQRRDRESVQTGQGAQSWDWADIPALRRLNRLGKLARALAPRPLVLPLFDRLAQAKVAAACARLGQGQTVVTDRLHGMILASVIGRRVEAQDNSTGKVAAYLETWGQALPEVRLAPDA